MGRKLELVRLCFCACRFRTNVPGPVSTVGAAFGRPKAFPLQGGRWLAEGQTDEDALLESYPSPAAKLPSADRNTEIISYLIYNKEAPSSCTPPYTQGGNFYKTPLA